MSKLPPANRHVAVTRKQERLGPRCPPANRLSPWRTVLALAVMLLLAAILMWPRDEPPTSQPEARPPANPSLNTNTPATTTAQSPDR